MSESRRPIDAIESLRSTRRSIGDGTIVGRSRSATPAKGNLRSAATAVAPEQDPIGETIALSSLGQTFDGGGTAINWRSLYDGIASGGFRSTVLPTDVVLIPRLAYYRLDFAFEWTSWRRGGRVEIVINGTVAWTVTSRWGARFDRTFDLGVLDVDDAIEVVISPLATDPDDPFAAADGQAAVAIRGSFVLVDIPKIVTKPEPIVSACGTWSGPRSDCDAPITNAQTLSFPSLPVEPGDVLLLTASGQVQPDTSICCSGGTPSGPAFFNVPSMDRIRSTYRGAGVIGSDQSCRGGIATIDWKIATGDEPTDGIDVEHSGTFGTDGRWCVFNLRDRFRFYDARADGSGLFQGNTVVPALEGAGLLVVQRSPSATGSIGTAPTIEGEAVELLAAGSWVEVYACGTGPSTVVSGQRNTGTRLRMN